MYRHVFNLQGIRHALTDSEALSKAADYMKSEFEKIGIEVIEEKFKVEGMDIEFRNIIGVIQDGDAEEIIISGHHDSVYDSPGANDNATACAAILEIARVLSKEDLKNINLRFVSFDLEEINPVNEKKMWDMAEKHGIMHKYTFTELIYRENFQKLIPTPYKLILKEGRDNLRKEIDNLSSNEVAYYKELIEYIDEFYKDQEWVGRSAVMGSSHYMKMANKEARNIQAIINFDPIGYTSKRKGSQILPPGFPVRLMKLAASRIGKFIPKISKIFRYQGVKDITVGDYAFLLVDVHSNELGEKFLKNARLVDLKIGGVFTQMSYYQIKENMPDILRSDHSPFWKEEIPGLFISDSANFRHPYYHTGGDTIEHVDFDFLKKIAQATLMTVLQI